MGVVATGSAIHPNTTSLTSLRSTASRPVSLGAAVSSIRSSAIHPNTTSLTSLRSTASRPVSLGAAVSSIRSSAISSTIPTSSGTSPSGTVPASSLSTSSGSFSSQSPLTSSSSQITSKNDTATVFGSSSKSLPSGLSTGSQSSTGSQPATTLASATTSQSASSGSSSSSLRSSSISTGPIITTVTTSGSTQILTLLPSSITSPPTLVINWSTVIPTTTSGVSSATHDSHGWPIIPAVNCWFCPPSGGVGGIGFVIPGITGPGILPPPPPGVEPPPGFSSNMPSITLDSAGDPTYESTEPTSQPTNSASTNTKSSSSSCTSTTTGYDLYVTCTSVTSTALLTSFGSASCETSKVTTTGCDVTTTASTTTVGACPLSASASISAVYLSERAAAGTVVSGTTYPLALWPTEDSVSSSLAVPTSGSSSGSLSGSSASSTSSVASTLATSTSRSPLSSAPLLTTPPPTPPPTTTTTSTAPTGPTGFHLVALRCSAATCKDTLEIVPSAQDSCGTIAQNQKAWWGGAFPHPAEEQTESAADQIPPFSVLKDSNDFDLIYAFGNDFSADLCGLPKLNFTFTQSSSTQWTWLDTDNNSGTCYDNTGSQASTCSHSDLTYTAQELLVCVQPNNPSYCASVSV
ncbi:uncharacterized protein BP5553_07896 [Venustampulla echinocandica]|uniref:Uncharacterized protein n=1 Tax=Venustampulla echinocandica TaxID=2656787 RepID=A0A370THV7_9HELO|nr:uncharacterized protein BP5553_07896 [Venustampulla echinocandica]RDL34768.1 hypothetical protein BP5553_07896 [Venustampulla echinocandica]